MPYSTELMDELNILMRFNLNSAQEGIKVHSTAEPAEIAATQRLFDKGLISQNDGGYLTGLGHTAAEHAQALVQILKDQAAA